MGSVMSATWTSPAMKRNGPVLSRGKTWPGRMRALDVTSRHPRGRSGPSADTIRPGAENVALSEHARNSALPVRGMKRSEALTSRGASAPMKTMCSRRPWRYPYAPSRLGTMSSSDAKRPLRPASTIWIICDTHGWSTPKLTQRPASGPLPADEPFVQSRPESATPQVPDQPEPRDHDRGKGKCRHGLQAGIRAWGLHNDAPPGIWGQAGASCPREPGAIVLRHACVADFGDSEESHEQDHGNSDQAAPAWTHQHRDGAGPHDLPVARVVGDIGDLGGDAPRRQVAQQEPRPRSNGNIVLAVEAPLAPLPVVHEDTLRDDRLSVETDACRRVERRALARAV